MKYDETFKRIFSINIDYDKLLKDIDLSYLEAMFEDKNLTYDIVIDFINKNKDEIISSSLKDESLIDNLLCEDLTIDKTKKHTINKEYLDNLISKIKNKQFDQKSSTFYLYIISIYNLYNSKYDDNSLKDILEAGIFSIVNNTILVSKDGDTIPRREEKLEKSDILLSWYKKCGPEILPNIFFFETLKNNITILLNSEQVKQNQNYQDKLTSLLKLCNYCILVRDKDIIPTTEEIKVINNIFKYYDYTNKSIALDSINNKEVSLVHFVRDNDVNYHLIGDEIINISDSSNDYDRDQSDFFAQSYFNYIVLEIEKETGKRFDITDKETRRIIQEKLNHYNKVMNDRPLDRLPIKKQEVGHHLRTYIRESDNRLSCSFITKDNIVSHLDRKIGLILKPKNPKAIISTSFGYTSEKDFYDFRKDSVPCTELFKQLGSSTNETCVNADECEVIGVLLLSNEEKVVDKAKRLAQTYNVEIINMYTKEKH